MIRNMRGMISVAGETDHQVPTGQSENSVDCVVRLRSRERDRLVPDRPVNGGNSRSFPDSPMRPLTCGQAG